MSANGLLISMLTLGLGFSGPSLSADELHVTFRGIVDLLDNRGETIDSRSLILIPNLKDPDKLPLVEDCRPKSAHEAYILYDATRVKLDTVGAGICARAPVTVRSCADGIEYTGYSLAGCSVRLSGSKGSGVETARWAVGEIPARPTDEVNLNWLIDMEALTHTDQLPLRRGLADANPAYNDYPILAARLVLDRGKLTAGYVYRSGTGPVRFRLPSPHPYRAGSTGLEWRVSDAEGKLLLCPLDTPDCAEPVSLQFSSLPPGMRVDLLVVSEPFGTEDQCEKVNHKVSHFYAHYVLRYNSENFEDCAGPEAPQTPEHGKFFAQDNPQCSPGDNQWP